MILELQEPFKSLWNKGYLYISNENRKTISLTGNNATYTITYARYLMCVKLGYILPTELEVDHIDNDKTNDNIDNLQVLTKEQNHLKEQLRYLEVDQVCYGVQCACCSINFILTQRSINMKLAQNVEFAFCSRSCANRFNSIGNKNSSSNVDIEKIKTLRKQGFTSYIISEITGYARNTVMKYW